MNAFFETMLFCAVSTGLTACATRPYDESTNRGCNFQKQVMADLTEVLYLQKLSETNGVLESDVQEIGIAKNLVQVIHAGGYLGVNGYILRVSDMQVKAFDQDCIPFVTLKNRIGVSQTDEGGSVGFQYLLEMPRCEEVLLIREKRAPFPRMERRFKLVK